MFGKPEWFREKTIGWGLCPVAWQGWVYALAWAVTMIGPFLALLATRREVEAMIWLAASIGMLTYDVWLILRELRKKREREVVYIGEGD